MTKLTQEQKMKFRTLMKMVFNEYKCTAWSKLPIYTVPISPHYAQLKL